MKGTWVKLRNNGRYMYRLICANMEIKEPFPLKTLTAFFVSLCTFTFVETNLHYVKNYRKHLPCFDVHIFEF